MKNMLFAAAVAAAAAIAIPATAQAPATPAAPQVEPAAPAAASEQAAPEQQGGGEAAGGPEMRWRGGWRMGGGAMMRHMMMHRMRMMRADPKERCIDRLARHAARRAYVEVELDLTDAQRPLWDKLESIARSAQQKARQLCDQLKAGRAATMLDRMDRAQAFLSARLAALQSAKPAVQALYQALTPEQKAIFDRPFRRD